ncbi:urea ABC transporter permease subunit UrtB [Paludibacterium yongneupense]|uniref:urea ABC transporter permease subunit UrtB n=1 Tax=Paludibacterium yongneupense TaxID=400061 RepID=UPI0004038476|nr:urea ABC transporter permease subunit UrtB [Paludibacterium yongneupense]
MNTPLLYVLAMLALLASAANWAAVPAAELGRADPASRADLVETWAGAPDSARNAAIAALENGQLLTDADATHVYLQVGETIKDVESGLSRATLPDGVDAVPVNNALRVALDTYHAASGLGDVSPAHRLAAVEALRQAANPALLPLLVARRGKESDPAVIAALDSALSTLQLASPDAGTRLAAIAMLAGSDDPALLTRLVPLTDPGSEADAGVRAAARHAVSAIKTRQMAYNLLGYAFSGLSLGSVLLLAALGLAITYGLLGVINMAHGEMLMLGAYATYAVQNLFRSHWPAAFDGYLLAALPVAFALTFVVGMALERLVIRHLYGRPLETLLATWGISLMLIQAVRVVFGAQNVEVSNPSWLSGGWQLTPALTLPYNRIAIIAFVAAVLLLTWLLLKRTRLGLFVRAVTQNRCMADSVGVATGRIDMLAFGLGSGIAGLGGVALSQIGNVGPELGQGYIVDSFMVVVLGGVGQLAGTVYGAMGLGVIGKILEPSLGAVLGKIFILVFIILFIQKRPQGLFALKGRTND